jgi:hypothetical protein
MRRRKTDLVQPAHLTRDQWRVSLESDRRMLLTQLRREVHTRGNTVQSYMNRIDRALASLREASPHERKPNHD